MSSSWPSHDLPIELFPLIVGHVVKASHLACICLVNKPFYALAVPLLYKRIVIRHWYTDWKRRVIRVFQTLADCPQLALHVNILGKGSHQELFIGDFPKGLKVTESDALLEICARALRNAEQLRSLIWTRDSSLSSEILNALAQNAHLTQLSINGNPGRRYDPAQLLGLTRLRELTLIMPSRSVVDILTSWAAILSGNLRSLTLICKESPWINDEKLMSWGVHLPTLERLNLVGCSKATHEDVWAIIRRNSHKLKALGLEVLTTAFDTAVFSSACLCAGGLTSLTSFTLTLQPTLLTSAFITQLVDLLSHSPLELFQLYAVTNAQDSTPAAILLSRIIAAHGQRLTKFSVHRIQLLPCAIDDVCAGCAGLQQLFFTASPSNLAQLGPILARALNLRAVHINLFPIPEHFQVYDYAAELVAYCGSTVTQFGMNTKVWQVARRVEEGADGEFFARPVLMPYEHPDVPEQFLVVRA
ncbi:hypothetical protein K488DRAFT_79788 [Vararia minispora EC-137]|uniref:Uncharacterized protein n=1 Tax=Vararia minispora EC-137 TaxID=1314806 RepID=A0ACB8QET3_9AGAM|nr:hypothetical protein K488DRAFT_79788 [Vararia minispora EC-137]